MKNTVAPFIASASMAETPFNIVFQGNSNKQVGKITIDKDKVTFTGEFDPAAQVFVEHIAKRWSQQWKNLEKRANEFDRFMDAMDTAKEALAAGTPLDLESLFKGEMASAMFATMFAGEFVRSGARNYLELGYNVPEMGEFTVTIQRKEGKTPGERIAELEAVVDQRNGECVRLINERDALREEQLNKGSNTRAAADIYFQLVEECQIPPGGSLVEYVRELQEKAERCAA
ncbi:hypothetical protein NZS27_003974 [Salmonella enterica]|uniref:Bacteriophage protein n=3 Tax=Enterobacteriaceae TaxID=543 RepID=A0A5T4PCP2_SALER|nr:hypothetical protein [Salmonella enterica]EBF8439044.1 hypothetical protein [Salmonella enterica subsp. enterica serovar Braenderup]ECE9908077.1 hypothetical protein [Salmonella enterica subsp. enterica serovar Virchow]ECT9587588.1 hypothetical protein [Salmonella enterica subsp. enterica serovar Montevideo]EDR6960163.1 hypothetical protein [Salmonella enterica subsp. enterica serovar Havana]EKS6748752.1 hypothetical protein [Enterobacter kobei]HAS1149114.1 hypothetical protein [Enterobact